MVQLPFYMEGKIKELLKDIVETTINEDENYTGFIKEIGNLSIALLVKMMRGNAVDKKMFESAKEPIEKLVAQALYPGLLYIYYPPIHELEIYGLGIKSTTGELKQIDIYTDTKELIIEQYEGDRMPFDFNENEIIGYSEGVLMGYISHYETPFKPVSSEEENLIKKLYDDYLKEDLKKDFKQLTISIKMWKPYS